MKKLARAALLAFFLLAPLPLLTALPVPGAYARVKQQISLPFTATYGNVGVPLLLVQATVNGKPATLIFDTGAQFLTITPELAKGLQPIATDEHFGLGITTQSSRVIVPVKLGNLTLRQCVAETQDMSNLSGGLGVKIDGLVGESLLFRFKAVTIDYENHIVDFAGN